MKPIDLFSAVQAGVRPSGPDDYGPHSDKVRRVFAFLGSDRLLRFSGHLDDRWFIPVHDIEKAESLAYNPEDEDFHWEEDGCLVWNKLKPLNVFENARVWEAFKPNLTKIASVLGELIDKAIPEEFRFVCYDSVLADLIEITGGVAKFGELDQYYGLVWEAYQQGGWPCGLTGGRPASDSDLILDGRKMYVLWEM
jgi:hypothetical protein